MKSVTDHREDAVCPASFNLADYVLSTDEGDADKIALSVLSLSGAERWSYRRLRTSVASMAHALVDVGLGPGDVLMLRLGHSPLFPISFLAAAWAGILPLPTSQHLTEDEVEAIAGAVLPKAVLFQDGVSLPRSPILRIRVHSLRLDGPTVPARLGSAERPGYILCTSGTSGTPRIVTHAHRAIWARRFMVDGWTGLLPSDRMLHAGAFNWSYTLGTGLLDPWTIGATALVLDQEAKLDALPLLAKRHDASILAGVPGIFRRLLKSPLPSLPKLRHALSAGEKLPESLRQRWRDTVGTDIHEAFGQTECSTFISGNPSRPAPNGSLGYAQPGRAVAIIDNGHPVDLGEMGEIAVSSDDPGLALATRPETEKWVGTGDLGQMSEDGAIYYLGRGDDMLTAGGFRISPIEIEQVYEQHPEIETAAAINHPIDPETNVIALYYTGHNDISAEVLSRHGSEHLAKYKVPRVFMRCEALPCGKNGKLLRKALRTERDNIS